MFLLAPHPDPEKFQAVLKLLSSSFCKVLLQSCSHPALLINPVSTCLPPVPILHSKRSMSNENMYAIKSDLQSSGWRSKALVEYLRLRTQVSFLFLCPPKLDFHCRYLTGWRSPMSLQVSHLCTIVTQKFFWCPTTLLYTSPSSFAFCTNISRSIALPSTPNEELHKEHGSLNSFEARYIKYNIRRSKKQTF